jgi:N-acetylglucosaminyldiphosphoundecaprenol N-acetyl-beta-D-mannosaminyltransferase
MLGTSVHAVSFDDLLAIIDAALATNQRLILAHQNMHGAYVARRDPEFRRYIDAAHVVYPDGMSMVAAGRLLGLPFKREMRSTSVDFVWPLSEYAASHGYRLFFVGGKPGVAEQGAARLKAAHPNLAIETHHGYFDKAPSASENQQVIEQINAFAPHLLIVGFGMPLQERWIADNYTRINAPIVWPIGALMDYLAGEIPTPPRWMGRTGLEWLYRVGAEPRRLWKRYIVEPWFLIPPLVGDLVRYRLRRGADRSQA